MYNVLILFILSITSPLAYPTSVYSNETKSINATKSLFELSKHLTKIAKSENLSRLEAYEKRSGSKIIIKKKAAQTINQIIIRSKKFSEQTFLNNLSAKYKRGIFDIDTKKTIKKEIAFLLKKIGYYKAKIKFTESILPQNEVAIDILIEEGDPCIIDRININLDLPASISIPISEGDICDSSRLRGAINQLERQLIDSGYNQFKIDQPVFNYRSESNRASVFIEGRLGKKISFEVIITDNQDDGISFDLLRDTRLNEVDSSISSPEYIRLELLRNYQGEGYSDALVSEGKPINVSNSEIKYEFEIKPGPKYVITEVAFDGLSSINETEAVGIMGLVGNLGTNLPYTEEIVESSVIKLRQAMQKRGYWDVKIASPRVVKNAQNGSVKLVFRVNEGRSRVLKGIQLTGNTQYSDVEILSWYKIKVGETFSPSDILNYQNKIREMYRLIGYLYVDIGISIIVDRKLNRINTQIIIDIQENERALIGEIYLSGNIKTHDDIIRNSLLFHTGDAFDPKAIEATRKELMKLSLFSFVSVRPSNPNDITNKMKIIDYEIIVRESRPGSVSFGPSWSLYEGSSFITETSYSNIGGQARQIFFKGGLKEEKDQTAFGNKTLLGRELGFGYLEPYVLDFPLDGRISVNHLAEADRDIWEISRSIESSLTYKLRYPLPNSKLEIYSLLRSTRIETQEDESRLILISKDNVQIREIGSRFGVDTRDSISWPTEGYILQGSLARAGTLLGGDTSYIKISAEIGLYYLLQDNIVLALGISGGSYRNIVRADPNPNVLPASEAFKSGGAITNRGFRDNELGPILVYEDKDGFARQFNTGGSQNLSGKIELRYQFIKDTFAVTAFTDFGNSFFSGKEKEIIDSTLPEVGATLYDNEPYRLDELIFNPKLLWERNYVSYGLALNYLSPLGSINLSYGFPLKRCITKEDCIPRGNDSYKQLTGGQIHVSVGTNF